MRRKLMERKRELLEESKINNHNFFVLFARNVATGGKTIL
jgi:hypothetical protein